MSKGFLFFEYVFYLVLHKTIKSEIVMKSMNLKININRVYAVDISVEQAYIKYSHLAID